MMRPSSVRCVLPRSRCTTAAELILRQRMARVARLGHVAALRRAREVEHLGEGQKVADLLDFHGQWY
jgi:hypothetical protein